MVFVILSILCVLTGCSSKKRFSGPILNPEDFKSLQVGKSSPADVISALGPATFGSFDPKKKSLFYVLGVMIVQPTRAVKLIKFKTYQVDFNTDGILTGISCITTKDMTKPSRTSTPSVYKRAPFLEELLSASASRFK